MKEAESLPPPPHPIRRDAENREGIYKEILQSTESFSFVPFFKTLMFEHICMENIWVLLFTR